MAASTPGGRRRITSGPRAICDGRAARGLLHQQPRVIAGWDLASQIEAALAVGQEEYAEGIAERLIDRQAEWEGVLYGGFDYTVLSPRPIVGALSKLEGEAIQAVSRPRARTDAPGAGG